MFTGRRKHDIVYVGMALSADLSIVSFQALDRRFVDQLYFFFGENAQVIRDTFPIHLLFEFPVLTLHFPLSQIGSSRRR